jgi:acyl carrier protein
MMTSFEKLRIAMAGTLKVPESKITEATRQKDLVAWDSLGHVNLMTTLEQTFDVQLDVEDFSKLNSVSAIIEYLNGHGID